MKPELTKVESATGTDKASQVKLTFSEPVSAVEAIKIDGKTVAASKYTLTSGATDLTISELELDATKEHTVELVNLEDLATSNAGGTNVTDYTSKTFTITVDKVAPTVESVSTLSDSSLVVTFSKPVTDLSSKTATDVFKFFDETTTDKASALFDSNTFEDISDKQDGTKWEIKLNATAIATGKTSADYKVQFTKGAVKDVQDNELAQTTKDVKFTLDKTAPKLTAQTIRTATDGKVKELKFTFDEDVQLASGVTTLGDLVDAAIINDDTSVEEALTDLEANLGDATLSVDGKVITATLVNGSGVATPAELSGKYNFTLTAEAVEDKAFTPNTNKATTFTLDFGAAKEAETFKIDSVDDSTENVIVVDYGQAVKGGSTATGSAAALSSYKLNGKTLPEGTKIVLDSAQEVATITLPAESIESSDTNAIFIIEGVVSKDGKKTVEKTTKTVSVLDNTAPELKTAVLNTDGSISVGFSEVIKTLVPADFVLTVDDIKIPAGELTFAEGTGSDSGKQVLTVATSVQNADDTAITADPTVKDYLYVDTDGVAGYDSAKDILVSSKVATSGTADDYAVGTYNLNKAKKITLATIEKPTTVDNSAVNTNAGNKLKGETTITVK